MYKYNFVFLHIPQHVPQVPSLNSVVWCSAWLRRHEIFACSSWKPSSSHRQRMRMHHAFLSPGLKRRFSAQACCLRGRLPAHSPRVVTPALLCTVLCAWGTSGECKCCQSRDEGSRCWWWCQGKATPVFIFQSCVTIPWCWGNKVLAEKSLSFLQYSSVDTKTSLQRCLNKKCFILWKCMPRVPPVPCHVNSDCIHTTGENLQD